jgi:hypothetical protein
MVSQPKVRRHIKLGCLPVVSSHGRESFVGRLYVRQRVAKRLRQVAGRPEVYRKRASPQAYLPGFDWVLTGRIGGRLGLNDVFFATD